MNQFSGENDQAEGGSDPVDQRFYRRSNLKTRIATRAGIAAGAGVAALLPRRGQSEQNRLMIVACALSALVLGGIFVHDRSGLASQGGNPMNVTRGTIDHVRVVADKPFDKVTKAFEQLRVLIYENEEGKTALEYDRASSLFGQFGNVKVTEVATMLDRKLEQLVARAIQ